MCNLKYKQNTRKSSCAERKRHTTRRATSVHCADLSWGGGGTYPGWGYLPRSGGYLPWMGVPTMAGVPCLDLARVGAPHLDLARVSTPLGVDKLTN